MTERLADTTRTLANRPGYLLVRTAMRVRQRYVHALAAIGLSPNQHVILSTLNEHGPGPQKEVAKQTRLDPGDIVAYLDALETGGYIERNRDPADRRRQIVSLTATGVQVLETADNALDAVEVETFSSLGLGEREALNASLETLYRSLE
ncbi:MarR family winged helix-turn-helix transcriptional regulator [Nocardia sp. NPDC004151]|uniref:MarR family winged helix-turn-helix transcriptional regulator n=1 Tax=Nocardia sp. NPDC004151 TaxID=3364304 RepID=UPI0036CE6C9C